MICKLFKGDQVVSAIEIHDFNTGSTVAEGTLGEITYVCPSADTCWAATTCRLYDVIWETGDKTNAGVAELGLYLPVKRFHPKG